MPSPDQHRSRISGASGLELHIDCNIKRGFLVACISGSKAAGAGGALLFETTISRLPTSDLLSAAGANMRSCSLYRMAAGSTGNRTLAGHSRLSLRQRSMPPWYATNPSQKGVRDCAPEICQMTNNKFASLAGLLN